LPIEELAKSVYPGGATGVVPVIMYPEGIPPLVPIEAVV